MARQRPSVQKRQREHQKRERERKKAEKAALKRERRLNRDEQYPPVAPEIGDTEAAEDGENAVRDD